MIGLMLLIWERLSAIFLLQTMLSIQYPFQSSRLPAMCRTSLNHFLPLCVASLSAFNNPLSMEDLLDKFLMPCFLKLFEATISFLHGSFAYLLAVWFMRCMAWCAAFLADSAKSWTIKNMDNNQLSNLADVRGVKAILFHIAFEWPNTHVVTRSFHIL